MHLQMVLLLHTVDLNYNERQEPYNLHRGLTLICLHYIEHDCNKVSELSELKSQE